MRKLLPLLTAAVVVVAVTVLSTGLGYAARARQVRPTLTVVSHSPLIVKGTHFRPHRIVHLTLTAAGTYRTQPRTNRFGAFTSNFHTAVDRCTQWTVTAHQGGITVLRRGPKPECAPAATP